MVELPASAFRCRRNFEGDRSPISSFSRSRRIFSCREELSRPISSPFSVAYRSFSGGFPTMSATSLIVWESSFAITSPYFCVSVIPLYAVCDSNWANPELWVVGPKRRYIPCAVSIRLGASRFRGLTTCRASICHVALITRDTLPITSRSPF